MTSDETIAAMHTLKLTVEQMAYVLGVTVTHMYRLIAPPEYDHSSPMTQGTKRLLQAYLDGYRPKDWPT